MPTPQRQRRAKRKIAERTTKQANKKRQLLPKVMEKITAYKKRLRSQKIQAQRAQKKIAEHAAQRLLAKGEPTL